MSNQKQFLIISKKIVTIPLLDHLTTGIEERFDHASNLFYSDLLIISSKMISLIYKKVNWEKNYFFADILKVIFHVPKCWRQNWTYRKQYYTK